MDPSELTTVLLNAQNPDISIRQRAEQWITNAQTQNFPLFVQILASELANNEKPALSRTLAGLLIKNTLTSKDEMQRSQQALRWSQIDANIRAKIKQLITETLGSPEREARHTAAQVMANIAHIELPLNQWPDLIQLLLQNMQKDDNTKQSSLEALGYICEEIESDILAGQSNEILTAVCKGIKYQNSDIKIAGCNALFNALEFVKQNFERESERNYIMHVLLEATESPDPQVQVASLECIVKIASVYYEKLAPYMQKLFNVTLSLIQKAQETVALQAIEFWSTLCEEEMYLIDEGDTSIQHFIRGASQWLLPVLLEGLTKQDDEPDEDTWNIAMSCGTCLGLVANTIEDEVVPPVMKFIEANIRNSNWKFREAATFAFGAIMDGPKTETIASTVHAALPVLLEHMKDQVTFVKDTTAWTIGRICEYHPVALGQYSQNVIQVMVEGLADESPKVAAHCAQAIHNLSESFSEDCEKPSGSLSQYFSVLLERLDQATKREDADESNLRATSYEAISALIRNGAQDTLQVTSSAIPNFYERLFRTLEMATSEEITELQSLLCGLLYDITQRLGIEGIRNWADKFMTAYLALLNKNPTIQEEVFIAIGSLANVLEVDFQRYIESLKPFIIQGLSNQEAYQVCGTTVGLVGDIARAISDKLTPYCDEFVSCLLKALQNPLLHRDVKPPILACFGDIALAIGGEFRKYCPYVMSMLQQASTTTVDKEDYDLVEYLNTLREGILEAYTGIIQGLRGDNAVNEISSSLTHIVQFVAIIQQDDQRTEAVTKAAVGVIGDIASAFGSQVKDLLHRQFVSSLISECMKEDASESAKTVAKWVSDVVSKL